MSLDIVPVPQINRSQALCSKYLHKGIKQRQDASRVTVIYQQFTHLSHFNFALSWIPAFSCNTIELGVFISSLCLFWLRPMHWSSLSHVPDDTILVNSIKKTNVTFVISKSWLWHGLDSWKGFIAFLGGGPSSSTFFFFFGGMSGMKTRIWQEYTWDLHSQSPW